MDLPYKRVVAWHPPHMSRNALVFVVPMVLFLLSTPHGLAKRRPAHDPLPHRRLAAMHAATSDQRTSDIVDLQKTIYSVLGQYDVPEIVSRFKPEFKRLNTDGTLSDTLDALYEMRLLDMQISIQHAKKMRQVLKSLGSR
jgi:hypothetical protein